MQHSRKHGSCFTKDVAVRYSWHASVHSFHLPRGFGFVFLFDPSSNVNTPMGQHTHLQIFNAIQSSTTITKKINGNISFCITSANGILLPALLRTGVPQTHQSQEFLRKQMPIGSVDSAHHDELGQESIASLTDPSKQSTLQLTISVPLKVRKRRSIMSPNVNIVTTSSTHCVYAHPSSPQFGEQLLHQISPMARLPLLK